MKPTPEDIRLAEEVGLAQAFSKVEGSAEKAANAYLAKQPKP